MSATGSGRDRPHLSRAVDLETSRSRSQLVLNRQLRRDATKLRRQADDWIQSQIGSLEPDKEHRQECLWYKNRRFMRRA